MWIEKRKDKLIACERFRDETLGKNIKISVSINKDTPQERKKALKQLSDKWQKLHRNYSDLKLSEIGELYFLDEKERVKEQTLKRDKCIFDNVLSIVGDIIVDDVKAVYIKDKLKASGKANVTLNGYLKTLNTMLKWAYRNEYMENAALIERLQKFPDASTKEKIKDKFLETSEVEALINGMQLINWKLLTQFLVLTGMRIGEAIALTDDDIDLKNRLISINKTYIHGLSKVGSPKTFDSIRTIPIQNELLPVISDMKRWTYEHKMITGFRGDIFFIKPEGGYIKYYMYEDYLKETAKRILGRKVTAHVLRHTFTSLMAEKGLSLEQISRQLGHSNSSITKNIYLHVTEGQKQKDADMIKDVKIFAH